MSRRDTNQIEIQTTKDSVRTKGASHHEQDIEESGSRMSSTAANNLTMGKPVAK